MSSFANLADGGRQLAPHVRDMLASDATAGPVVLLAAIPNGVPVALAIGSEVGVRVTALPVTRTDEGPVIGELPELAGCAVLVIDDGVETGSVARAAAAAIRPLAPQSLRLAVPVCPREAMADMQRLYDDIIAVDMPFGRRALTWHYADFDTIDQAGALALLAAQT